MCVCGGGVCGGCLQIARLPLIWKNYLSESISSRDNTHPMKPAGAKEPFFFLLVALTGFGFIWQSSTY